MLKGFVSGEEKDIKRIPMKGKNLLDESASSDVDATHINYNKGTPVVLTAGQTYTFSCNTACNGLYIRSSADDSNLASANNSSTLAYTPQANVSAYFRIRNNNGITNLNPMFNLGSTPLPYEPYGYQEGWEVRDSQDRLIWGREDELQTATGTLPFKGYALPVKVKSLLGNAVQNGTPAPDNIVTPEMCGVRTGNLHNPETDVFGYIDPNGNISSSSVTKSTDFIPCESGSQYVLRVYKTGILQSTNQRTVDFYASDKSYIDVGWDNRVKYVLDGDEECLDIPFSVPTGARFLRFCYDIGYSKSMLNPGSTALPYEPYGWKISLTNAGQTLPVYLGEVPTVRRVKKLVLTGEENIDYNATYTRFVIIFPDCLIVDVRRTPAFCTHYEVIYDGRSIGDVPNNSMYSHNSDNRWYIKTTDYSTTDAFKEYLASEYQAGHPVTVWYVLSAPTTGIVNEPLAKISTYADELTTIQVHGLSAPLYGIGDYKDTLDLSTGVVTRKVKKLVLTGNEKIDIDEYLRFSILVNNIKAVTGGRIGRSFCSHYECLYHEEPYDNNWNNVYYQNGSTLFFHDRRFTGVSDFKAYLAAQYQAGTPVTIWYVLNTPTTETVTVPTGMTGEIEGYLTQVSTPTPTNRSVPKWNGMEESGGTYAVTVYTPPEIPITTGQNTLTVDTTLAPSKLEVSVHAKKIHYGFKIDKSNDDSDSAVIYTHDAVTMTPAHMDFTNDRFDYGSWSNAFFVRDCYPVALNLDGTEAYRLDPDDYTKKTDGTSSDIFYELLTEEPSDWSTQWKQYYTKSGDEYILNSQSSAPTFVTDTYYKLTYSSSFTGNFMMAFPKVWFYRHEDSQYNYIEISNHRLSDDWKCYAHINANGQEVDFIYLPLFKGVIKDSKLRSLPGQIPQGNTTATTEVNAATALGSRWQIWDHSSAECLNDLLTLMSKSIDSQGRFGKGRESGYNSSDMVAYGKLQTGTLIKGGKFHGFSSSYKEVKVFGIEGFWANRWDRLQGMLLVNNVWKIKMTPPYNFTGTDFVTLSNASVPTGNGYLSKVQTSEYGSIPASIDGGSSTKYFKDYFYKTATDTRVALRGGGCRSGAACGFRCVGVGSAASYSDWSIGASPLYK